MKYFSKVIWQVKEIKHCLRTSSLKQIFLLHTLISYQPLETHIWQHNQQSLCDVTSVFIYSPLITTIEQWVSASYPNYFINYLSYLFLVSHWRAKSNHLQHPGSFTWECSFRGTCSANQRAWSWRISRGARNSGKHYNVPDASKLYCCSHHHDGECFIVKQ